MAPCDPRFLFETAGEEIKPMMKTILQSTRAELAILFMSLSFSDALLSVAPSQMISTHSRRLLSGGTVFCWVGDGALHRKGARGFNTNYSSAALSPF